MPLQNRVTPQGDIIATPHRGMFTGNRGIIHDPATKTLLTRRWASQAWLTCVCEFRGRRREVMGGAQLDRAVLSRRGDRVRGGASSVFLLPPRRCQPVSRRVGRGQWRQRTFARATSTPCCTGSGSTGGRKRLHALPMPLQQLPDGAMVQAGAESYLIAQGRALLWSPAGYREAQRARRRHAADAAFDIAGVWRGISAGAA